MKKNNLVKQSKYSPLLNRNASGDDAIRKKRDGEGFQINSTWEEAAVSGKLITHREVLPTSKALHQLPHKNVKKREDFFESTELPTHFVIAKSFESH